MAQGAAMIRLKFRCIGVTKRVPNSGNAVLFDAELLPVTTGSPENDKVFTSSPNGTLKLLNIHEDAFTPGMDYFVDITPTGAGVLV